MATAHRPRVLILGGGFAGVAVAQELVRLLPRREACDITLVDQNDFFLFTPMLTEVVGGEVDPGSIVVALRALSPRVTFERGRVERIDAASKMARISIGDGVAGVSRVQRNLCADYLVIALGSVTNFHRINGLEEHALTVKTVGEAETIRNRTIALLERADEEPDTATRRALLTFVVAGGGFSGVETMAALNDLVRPLVVKYPHVNPADVRTILIHTGSRLLPELDESLARYAQSKLEERGVEVMLDTAVTGAASDHVEVAHHQERGKSQPTRRIEAHTLIWTGGVQPNPVVEQAGLTLGRHHGIVVDECCSVRGHVGVWALGDCAEVPQPAGGNTYAPTAQNATREATQVARNIVACLHGEPMKPFVYHPIGQLALVGRRSGVAQLYGIQLSGVVAWAMWRGIYLAKLPQVAKRVRVGLDWLLDAVAGRELAALPGMVSETGRSNTLASESVPTRSQETKTKAKSSP